jgi:hypothetical protein
MGHPACLYETDVGIFSQDPVGVQIVYILWNWAGIFSCHPKYVCELGWNIFMTPKNTFMSWAGIFSCHPKIRLWAGLEYFRVMLMHYWWYSLIKTFNCQSLAHRRLPTVYIPYILHYLYNYIYYSLRAARRVMEEHVICKPYMIGLLTYSKT